jgi:hypothetical protein
MVPISRVPSSRSLVQYLEETAMVLGSYGFRSLVLLMQKPYHSSNIGLLALFQGFLKNLRKMREDKTLQYARKTIGFICILHESSDPFGEKTGRGIVDILGKSHMGKQKCPFAAARKNTNGAHYRHSCGLKR